MSRNDKTIFGILDWYIIKKLLSTFALAIVLIVFVVIMFDLTQKIDDFIQNKAPLNKIIFSYYLKSYAPNFVNMFGYLFFFIAVVFVTSRLAARTEIIAILNGGVSFARLLQPFIVTATFIALLNLGLTNLILPKVNAERLEFEKTYYRNPYRNNLADIHIQQQANTYVYVQRFDNSRNMGYRFTQETFSNNSMTQKLYADVISYDSVTKLWKMENWIERKINGKYESIERGFNKTTDLKLKPEEFNVGTIKPEELDYRQLNAAIERETLRGSKLVRLLLVEKYQRLINPAAYIVLTIIGVSLSCRKTRGGMGLHLALGIALAFVFILIMKVTTVMATQSNLHPSLSVGFPIIVFFIFSLYLVKKAPK
ncbi:MAG: LptF/LptG family permease [Bacteroidales bacterium]|jgi:lipopolysaccharide export system permease protein|nr:LptF/LptG family permease [Bacteroidales bacterium]